MKEYCQECGHGTECGGAAPKLCGMCGHPFGGVSTAKRPAVTIITNHEDSNETSGVTFLEDFNEPLKVKASIDKRGVKLADVYGTTTEVPRKIVGQGKKLKPSTVEKKAKDFLRSAGKTVKGDIP